MPRLPFCFTLAAACLLSGLSSARAQFHKPGGAPVAAAAAVPGTPQAPLGMPPAGTAMATATGVQQGGNLVSSQYGRLGVMDEARLEVWGKSIHHTDGSYTESKSDIDPESNSLQQVTKSKEGVVLQRREVNLNELGQPSEVLVYDGRNQLRFRGVLTYDNAGRFREEVLYTPQNVAVRRKIQEYGTDGRMIPLKVVDYAKNGYVPEGMELIVTPNSENPTGKTKRGFLERRRDATAEQGSPEPAETEAAPAKKPGFLGRLFGKD